MSDRAEEEGWSTQRQTFRSINCASGYDEHLHQFLIRGKPYGIGRIGGIIFDDHPRQVRLRDFHFRLKETWLYEYDLTDWWQHEIRLELVLPFDPAQQYPVCTAGKRRGPIEDCGGPWAFMELQDEHPLWKVLPEFAQFLLDHQDDLDNYQDEFRLLAYWVAYETFHSQAINRRLAEYAPTACVSNIDRTLIVKYIAFLHNNRLSDKEKGVELKDLRLFLETCTDELKIEGFTRELLIFDSDYPKQIFRLSRELPEEIIKQLRASLHTLQPTISRTVVVLLKRGLRLQELCSLPIYCLIYDDKHEWYLHFFQAKLKQENIIPLVNETVIGVIQAQQKEIREQWGTSCSYLFPSLTSPTLPFKQVTFSQMLNKWAYKANICDATGKLFRFQSHQFRHTVGMRLINEGVPSM